ncbi:MAG: 50S ribosomal protein L29 [Microgenomates group bacterium]|nr:50S ribosomal protein L29 [Microgenomates group bacterium]
MKGIKELRQKTIKELENESRILREEIGKLNIEFKINPAKDTNLLTKKRKRLSVILTILKEKKDSLKLENKN